MRHSHKSPHKIRELPKVALNILRGIGGASWFLRHDTWSRAMSCAKSQPWIDRFNSLLSWWDMEKFSAKTFFDVGTLLQNLIIVKVVADTAIHADSPVTKFLSDLCGHVQGIGLRQSWKHVNRMREQVSEGTLKSSEFQLMLTELQHRIRDEMEDQLFMYLPVERAKFYNQPELFGQDVNTKFVTIQFDIVEAGNCYAAGRGTAAVFHLMRIMESAVQEFGKKLGVSFVDEKNWHNILEEIDKAIKALPKSPQRSEMSQVCANLYAVKLAWRNEVMHPKDTYTLEEADNIIRQVKIFMQQLTKVV
jgi:hypothetical protein